MSRTVVLARILSPVLLGLLVVAGCKTMTTAQERQQKLEEKQVEEAKQVSEESAAEVAELDRQQAELKRKAQQLNARIARDDRRKEAITLLESNQPEEALAILEEILARDGVELGDELVAPPMEKPEKAQVYLVKGTANYDLDRVDAAIADFSKAAELDSGLRPARINAAKLLFAQREFARAIEFWRKDLQQGFRSGETLFLLAQCHYEVGRQIQSSIHVEAARVAVRGALVENPEDPELSRWLALLEFETGRYSEAIRIFQNILNSAPLDATYMEYLANCYLKMEQYDKAADVLEMVARVRPPGPELCMTLGDLYQRLGLPERAAEWLMRGFDGDVERTPPEERYSIGLLLADAGRPRAARRWLEAVPESHEKRPHALRRLGFLLMDDGDLDGALDILERARAERPEFGEVHLVVGDLRLERKELAMARLAYGKASSFEDTKADGLAGLAEVFYEEGNLEQAIASYQRALKERPGDRRFQVTMDQIRREYEVSRAGRP